MEIINKDSFRKKIQKLTSRPINKGNILTIESRSCTKTRNSKFLLPTYSPKEEEISKRQEFSLTPKKIGSLMKSLSKAETYLKEVNSYAKYRILKEKLKPPEDPIEIAQTIPKSMSLKRTKPKIKASPVRIPRSGLNIQCLYKYGL